MAMTEDDLIERFRTIFKIIETWPSENGVVLRGLALERANDFYRRIIAMKSGRVTDDDVSFDSNECFEVINLCLQSIMHDLESTRRENEFLRRQLDDVQGDTMDGAA